MSASTSEVVQELETALRDGSEERRNEILRRVTDLFIVRAGQYSKADTGLFDEVMGHLINHVERRALVELSVRLAKIKTAPSRTIGRLARNDAIEISGPVLAHSERLDDADLIEIASSKSQAHLATIARRPQIAEAVTEVLVDYGDAEVANEVARNAGARLSKLTMAKLVMRAEGDERLTGAISRRPDISRPMFRHLMMQATETVRQKLLAAASPGQRTLIQQVLDEISVQVCSVGRGTRNYSEAQRIVAGFSQDTDLTRSKIADFASSRRICELITALSVLSGLRVAQVQALFDAPSDFGLLALCRSVMLEWKAACAVVTARPARLDGEGAPVEELQEQFAAMSPRSAQQVIAFWQSRQGGQPA